MMKAHAGISYLISAVLVVAVGCGGSVKTVKMDLSNLPADKRAKIQAKQTAMHEAKEKAEKVRREVKAAGDEVAKAEAVVKSKKGDLAVAKKKLDLEEAKSDAGKAEAVSAAKDDVSAKEKELNIAKESLDYEEAKEEYLEAQAAEAEAEQKVAAADLELTKLKVKGGEGPEYDAQVAEFEQQHREAQADHAGAKKKAAEELKEKQEAEDDLNNAKGA